MQQVSLLKRRSYLGDVERVARDVTDVHHLHVAERVHLRAHVVPGTFSRARGGKAATEGLVCACGSKATQIIGDVATCLSPFFLHAFSLLDNTANTTLQNRQR